MIIQHNNLYSRFVRTIKNLHKHQLKCDMEVVYFEFHIKYTPTHQISFKLFIIKKKLFDPYQIFFNSKNHQTEGMVHNSHFA